MFDKTRHFAIVQLNLLDCKGRGKMRALLYTYSNDKWKEVGELTWQGISEVCGGVQQINPK